MNISPVKINNFNFKSTNRTVYRDKKKGDYVSNVYDPYYSAMNGPNIPKMVYSNKTFFLRNDFPWGTIGKYLQDKYPTGKVNIYNFACSDGSEPYSLALSLIDSLGEEEAQRFFPIIASDIDSEIIKQAKKGRIKVTPLEYEKLCAFVKKPKTGKDYFDIEYVRVDSKNSYYILKPKEILSKNVQFKCEGIEEGLNNVEKSNSFVMARNFWKYLSAEQIATLSLKLRNGLDDTSLIAIGDFDKSSNTPFFFFRLGIIPVSRYEDYSGILKVSEFFESPFLRDENLWHKKVQEEYENYKLNYGVY